MKKGLFLILGCLLSLSFFAQGPYAPPANQTGTTAIHKDSSIFIAWATSAVIERGWQNITDTTLGKATVGNNSSPTDKSGINGVVSLGDGGFAILTFNTPIINGSGADFAVFENSFNNTFLELAFVEVSSDGVNFFRFDAISLTDAAIQLDNNAIIDATNLYNLAGKYRAQYGTPFDLDELTGITGLDVNNITHIKIIDVVGSINPTYGSFDSQNNIINDPWTTPFASGGFDLDAVGVIHTNSTGLNDLDNNFALTLYPNPVKAILNIKLDNVNEYLFSILNLNGQKIMAGQFNSASFQIDLSNLNSGIYFLQLQSDNNFAVKKFIKK